MNGQCLSLVPYPKSVEGPATALHFEAGVRAPDMLQAAATVLSDLSSRLTGRSFPLGQGDVVLALDPALSDEAYTLCVKDTVRLTAGTAQGICRAAATLLQLMVPEENGFRVPQVTIQDEPDRTYRGLMVDLARKWHPFGQVLRYVDLCFFYKINYLHLHLTDDQAFTFPSRAFPRLATPIHHYTRQQLTYLINYAEDRGITLLPEIDLPGHSRCLTETYPDIFANDPPAPGLLCIGRPGALAAVDTLVGELCEAFPRSPMIHVGGDEAQKEGWESCRYCREYRSSQGLADTGALYARAVGLLVDMVRRRGHQPVVWEGFSSEAAGEVGRDVLVMPFESSYYPPDRLLCAGYSVINTSWKPLYITPDIAWPAVDIYSGWDLFRWGNWVEFSSAWPDGIVVPPSDRVLGAQLCLWEGSFTEQWPRVRPALAALSERVWTVARQRTTLDFLGRLEGAGQRLTQLLPHEPVCSNS